MLDSNSLIYIYFFPNVIVTLFYLRACDIALRYYVFRYLGQFSIKFLNHLALSLDSVLFWFLSLYSSFYVYFFASPDQRNICKFTSLSDFQLVHQFLRNIVIYFLSVEPLFLHIHCYFWSLWTSNAFGLPLWLLQLCKH